MLSPRSQPYPDELILRIDPNPGADLVVQAKKPGAQTTRTVDLSLIFSEELGDLPEPYERLLGDALRGDSSLFTREDSVEETWRIVQPLLDSPPPVRPIAKGSWGPAGRRQTAGRVPPLARAVAAFSRNALEVRFLGGSPIGAINKPACERDRFDFPRRATCQPTQKGGNPQPLASPARATVPAVPATYVSCRREGSNFRPARRPRPPPPRVTAPQAVVAALHPMKAYRPRV